MAEPPAGHRSEVAGGIAVRVVVAADGRVEGDAARQGAGHRHVVGRRGAAVVNRDGVGQLGAGRHRVRRIRDRLQLDVGERRAGIDLQQVRAHVGLVFEAQRGVVDPVLDPAGRLGEVDHLEGAERLRGVGRGGLHHHEIGFGGAHRHRQVGVAVGQGHGVHAADEGQGRVGLDQGVGHGPDRRRRCRGRATGFR